MSTLRESFDATVESSRLITPTDSALVESGRKIATQIDYAIDNLEGQDVTKALYLTPHLVNILREMLATPASRRAAGIHEEDSGGGALAKLRAVAGGKLA